MAYGLVEVAVGEDFGWGSFGSQCIASQNQFLQHTLTHAHSHMRTDFSHIWSSRVCVASFVSMWRPATLAERIRVHIWRSLVCFNVAHTLTNTRTHTLTHSRSNAHSAHERRMPNTRTHTSSAHNSGVSEIVCVCM